MIRSILAATAYIQFIGLCLLVPERGGLTVILPEVDASPIVTHSHTTAVERGTHPLLTMSLRSSNARIAT